MPFTPAAATGILATQLAATGCIGPGAIKLASSVANGTSLWLASMQVTTVDVGAVGAGVGAIPLLLPPPILIANFSVAFSAQGILGPMAPSTILGLSNGLALAFLTALIVTTHPGVGSGAAVVRFLPPPATPLMVTAFSVAGMVTLGSVKMATAIGVGLTTAFSLFITASPIVGAAGPVPSAGVGFGNVV